VTIARGSRRWSITAAIAILGLSATLTALSILSVLAPGSEALPNRPSAFDLLMYMSILLLFPVVGLVVVLRQPGNAVGWLFLGVGATMVANTFASEYADRAIYAAARLPAVAVAVWVESWCWILPVGLCAPLAIALFPNGALPGRRWRPVVALVVTSLLVVAVALALAPGPLVQNGGFDNPFGVQPLGPWVPAINTLSPAPVLAMISLALCAIVVRFRRSHGVERQQLKVLLYPVALIAVGFAVAVVSAILLRVDVPFAWEAMIIGLAGVPIAAGIAILRYRLYDIDVVIRRTLIYGVLIAILGAVYVALVVGLQTLMSAVTGGQTLPVALSTLTIAALFGPVRAQVRRVIDRRFYRSRYDAQQTVERFAAQMRDQVELDEVGRVLVAVAADAVRPASIGVWVRPHA
jgi:hypothetical protein